MAVGQVSFKDQKKVYPARCASLSWEIATDTARSQVKRMMVIARENPIVNRLNKTKVERYPDLAMEREERLKAARMKDQAAQMLRVCWLRIVYPYHTLMCDVEERGGANCPRSKGEEVAKGSCI